jgi:Zn-finger nucleic acid-binding protein
MHTYTRSGVQIEQCSGCRGIFLDYGELEHITQLEAQWGAAPPPAPPAPHAPGPAWGAPQQHGGHYGHGHHGRRRGGLTGLFFSS